MRTDLYKRWPSRSGTNVDSHTELSVSQIWPPRFQFCYRNRRKSWHCGGRKQPQTPGTKIICTPISLDVPITKSNCYGYIAISCLSSSHIFYLSYLNVQDHIQRFFVWKNVKCLRWKNKPLSHLA
jgi:hypothetical protein